MGERGAGPVGGALGITHPRLEPGDGIQGLAGLEEAVVGEGGARAIALIAIEAIVGVGARGGEAEQGAGAGVLGLGEAEEEGVRMGY